MMAAVKVFQPGLRDVSIDLRGGQVCMTQHHLHGPEIRPMIQQVSCECMTKGVGRDGAADSRHLGVTLDGMPEGLPCHGPGTVTRKQGIRGPAREQLHSSVGDKVDQRLLGLHAHGYQSFLAALAEHPDHTLLQIDGRSGQRDQLRNPEARCVKEFQHGVVPPAQGMGKVGPGKEYIHFPMT